MKNVFFSVPLAGKRDDAGWEIAGRMLGNTLASVLNQTDPAFEVVITGHERPSIPELDDPRVTFLVAPFEKPTNPPEYHLDKRRKRRNNAIHIKSKSGGYIVFLDADDLVSRNLVGHIMSSDDPHGYIFNDGYLLDHQTGIMSRRDEFDQHCGSCAAIHFSPDEIDEKEDAAPFSRKSAGHPKWARIAAEKGRPLRPVPFPAAVYVVNTSQNLSVTKDEVKAAKRLERLHYQPVPMTPGLIEEFSLGRSASVQARMVGFQGAVRGLLARLSGRPSQS